MVNKGLKNNDTLNFSIDKFSFEYHKHSLLFSSKLNDTFFLYKNLKNYTLIKNENYKLINFGIIPPLSINSQINNFYSNIYCLDYQNDSFNILNKFNVLNEILKNDPALSYKCPKRGHILEKNSTQSLTKNIFDNYQGDIIAIGENKCITDNINVKELIKKGIFNIIYNDSIMDIDDINTKEINNFYIVKNKISLSNFTTFKNQFNSILNDYKNQTNDFFIFSTKNNNFKIYNINDKFICRNCSYEFDFPTSKYNFNKNSDLNSLSNIFYNNISLSSLFNDPFNILISKIENIRIKNLLANFINFGLESLNFLSQINNLTLSYILNYIDIKNKINKNDILIIQNPLSFIERKYLEQILKELKNISIIIFENNNDIFSLNFDKVYNLTKHTDSNLIIKQRNSVKLQTTITKNKVNIISYKNLENIINLAKESNLYKKVNIIYPLFFKSTTLMNLLDIFSKINDIFLQTTDAKVIGLQKKDFFLKTSNKYLCKICQGKGKIKEIEGIYKICPKCNGNLFNDTILNLKFKNVTLKEVYNFNITEASEFFKNFKKIYYQIDLINKMKLGELRLNFQTDNLTSNIINTINIFSNFNELQNSNLYIIKNAFSFLSNSQKLRFIDILESSIENNTIILEAI